MKSVSCCPNTIKLKRVDRFYCSFLIQNSLTTCYVVFGLLNVDRQAVMVKRDIFTSC
jgi:hypothetical protein